MRASIARVLVMLASVPAALPAQSHDHADHSQYVGIQSRDIKALDSAVVANYLAGAGMGFALSAELNGHPGPRHTLELADSLALSTVQRDSVQRIFERMQTAAIAIGSRIVELERELDRRFAHRHIDPATLTDLTARIGALNGRLRAIHLQAHLETTALMSERQIQRYLMLRGYPLPD